MKFVYQESALFSVYESGYPRDLKNKKWCILPNIRIVTQDSLGKHTVCQSVILGIVGYVSCQE